MKPACRNLGEEAPAVTEMMLGGSMRHTRAPGALAKRKALDAAFHEDLLPGVEQSLVQIAVMIGVTRRQYRLLLTEQTPV